MFSLQDQTSAQASTDPTQEPLIWKHWKHKHPEFNREKETKITYDGDKILILGGNKLGVNMILMDPEKQAFKIIPSVGDVESCSLANVCACYWKDSTVVVFGGYDRSDFVPYSTVAIVTLKDLDSDNPSAHWEKIVTPTKLFRHQASTYIYKDKMYAFGGWDEGFWNTYDVWCLDLAEFTWTKCNNFKEFYPGKKLEGEKAVEFQFVFHENRVYATQKGRFVDVEIIREFDLETMTYKLHPIPKSPTDEAERFDPCPQVIDGKIYFLNNLNSKIKGTSPMRQVLAFDLASRNWTEIKTESFPSLDFFGLTLYCKDHLIFNAMAEKNICRYGQFWSLPLTPPKPSKCTSTSTTINKVQKAMKEFFFEAPYSDVSFEVESQTIPAHKWLLTQRNEFFANLFSNEMPDSPITITGLKATTFRALLEYLYSDHVEIDDTIALELLQQAKKYSIPTELKTLCEKHLVQNIEPENYFAFGKLAESIGASSLREAVVVFIARNMKKIKPRKDFNEISDALLRDSIVKFIVK